MDEAAREKHCSILTFDDPPQPYNSNKDISDSYPMPLMIDCTTSLENSSIRDEDNFVFTSFVESIKSNPQSHIKSVKNQKQKPFMSTSISNEIIFNNITVSCGEVKDHENDKNDTSHPIIDESSQQKKEKKPPRPPNAFILYRQAKQPIITRERGNISNNDISKLLAELWRNETDEVRLYWRKVADRKKMEHMQLYPGYVFRPRSEERRV